MMNVYSGNVVLVAQGEAWVTMPEWFEALNRDFRYQLTSIGAPGPNLHIAVKVEGNRFKIAGGGPTAEVSWQVTGVRQDAWANAPRGSGLGGGTPGAIISLANVVCRRCPTLDTVERRI